MKLLTKRTMKNEKLVVLVMLFGMAAVSLGVVIDFTGGTATLLAGGSVVTDNDNTYWDVDYYVEDGMMIDFIGDGDGVIGDYYGVDNSVIHAHHMVTDQMQIVFSKVDGTPFDLNYVDLISNTEIGGGKATGNEISHITTNSGYSMLLPTSDWGFSDGVMRIEFNSNFDGITSFTISSTANTYCVGLDNFYIDEVPEPATMLLLGLGALVLRKRK